MRTTINESSNYCGYYVGKPIRVTVNALGNVWTEAVGWKPDSQNWLGIPNTKPIYIGPEKKINLY